MPSSLAENAELAAYYADRRLFRRNLAYIMLLQFSWSVCFGIVQSLMVWRLNSPGVGFKEGAIGLVASINSWAVSLLVMYFSWKSDHTVSRLGRRCPYLFISTPIIVLTVILFPFCSYAALLMGLYLFQLLAMDVKNSTIPLLSTDCSPRSQFGRVNALFIMLGYVFGFASLRFGMPFAEKHPLTCYLATAGILTGVMLLAGLSIKEPPVRNPTSESFKPWSTMQIAWKDRRNIVLMLAVSMVPSCAVMLSYWQMLWAKNALNLHFGAWGEAVSWAQIVGMLLAFPVGWLIDRIGCYVVLLAYWLMQVIMFIVALHVTDGHDLTVLAIVSAFGGPLAGAGFVFIYQIAPREHLGSYTASRSFLYNMYLGFMYLLSGQLIQRSGGNYKLAFVLGIVMSTVGVVLLCIHQWLVRGGRAHAHPSPAPVPAAAAASMEAGFDGASSE